MGIPDKLPDKGNIDQDIVNGNDNLPARLTRQNGTDEVTGITETPFDEEEEREAGGRLELVIGIDLGDLGKEPGDETEGAQHGGHESEG